MITVNSTNSSYTNYQVITANGQPWSHPYMTFAEACESKANAERKGLAVTIETAGAAQGVITISECYGAA